ncbi:MAG: hypothetical protein H0W04_05605 [Chthoniobacterales bacterium]|nr:hypothetical protein [Chthoniobacterales bacterium]
MSRILTFFVAAANFLTSLAALAQHDHSNPASSIKAELVAPATHVAGKTAPAVLRLTGKDGKAITLDQLQVAHTEKLHLLVIDDTLTDYHHEHPVAGENPGEYRFDFAPRFGGTYHVWADVVPSASGQQEYAKAQVKVQGPAATKSRTLNATTDAEGYRFSLTTENDEPLQAGKATMVKIKVTTSDGRDFTALEPVMGAFAHMVAFPENLASVTHVHPMGTEPQAATERGGPELSFHVEPEMPGFQKFFLQTQIGGREAYAAFGVEVNAPADSAAHAGAEYTCPMHPEVKLPKPGKCPKCGMALSPAKAEPHDKHEHQH